MLDQKPSLPMGMHRTRRYKDEPNREPHKAYGAGTQEAFMTPFDRSADESSFAGFKHTAGADSLASRHSSVVSSHQDLLGDLLTSATEMQTKRTEKMSPRLPMVPESRQN